MNNDKQTQYYIEYLQQALQEVLLSRISLQANSKLLDEHFGHLNNEIKEYQNKIHTSTSEINYKQSTIESTNRMLEEAKIKIQELNVEIQNKQSTIESTNRMLEEAKIKIQELNVEIQNFNIKINTTNVQKESVTRKKQKQETPSTIVDSNDGGTF